jgi:hypothetical protein
MRPASSTQHLELGTQGSVLSTWYSPLKRRHRIFLWCIAAGFLALLFPIELRSAFLKRPMTDLQVYLRAAWAVRTGHDLYAIIDDNKWHYHYPAVFAIGLVPLANAPPGNSHAGMLAFHEAVALWYFFSLLCLIAAAHWLATALEEKSSDPAARSQPRWCYRWWALRLWPVLVCLTPVGQTLVRGQVNLLVLAMLCAMLAAALRRQSWRAGLWLSAAVCVKIIPVFLLLYPVWRRDWRWLGGSVAGLIVGLVLIPAAVFGPSRAWHYTQEWGNVLLRPVVNRGGDHARDKELVEATATDSQSPLRVIHFALYPDITKRPDDAAPWVRHVHWLIGGLLTLITMLAIGRRPHSGPALVLVFALLIIVMLMVSPVCHQHYLCLMLPAAAGLIAQAWECRRPAWLSPVLLVVLPVVSLALFLPFIPGWGVLRDHGLPGAAALLLWALACIVLQSDNRASAQSQLVLQPRAAA